LFTDVDETRRRRLLSHTFNIMRRQRRRQLHRSAGWMQQLRLRRCDASLAWRTHTSGCSIEDLATAG
jgi:hypothetical protein